MMSVWTWAYSLSPSAAHCTWHELRPDTAAQFCDTGIVAAPYDMIRINSGRLHLASNNRVALVARGFEPGATDALGYRQKKSGREKMRDAKLAFVSLLMMLCAPAIAFTQGETGNPENWCRNGAFPMDTDFKLAKVVGQRNAKIHFLGDEGDCPKSNEAKCRMKSYLIPGDQVLVSRKFGSWVCGWYQPKKGSETVGWLPVVNLSIIDETSAPSLEQWVGIWREYDNSLNISRDGATPYLKVDGQAYWRGLGENVNEGSFAARAEPQGNRLMLEDDGCKVSLTLVGDHLIAHDNFQCGGMNVRFDGVYRRR